MAEIPNRTQQRSMEMLELLSRKSEGLFLHELAKELALPRSICSQLSAIKPATWLCVPKAGDGEIST